MVEETATPLVLAEMEVAPEWVDYNGHMNDAAYAQAFSRAGDRWMARIRLGDAERQASGCTLYTLQMMLHYFKEAKVGAPLRITCQLLEHDSKRARLWMEMRSPPDGDVISASEHLFLCVRQGESPRAAPWPNGVAAALGAMATEHARLSAPPLAGRGISLRRA